MILYELRYGSKVLAVFSHIDDAYNIAVELGKLQKYTNPFEIHRKTVKPE